MQKALNRRDLLKSSAILFTAGVWSTTSAVTNKAESSNEKLNLAVIGLGGQGAVNLKAVASQNIVALCDVDEERAGKAYEAYPRAKRFDDFRRMFDELDKQIDAVVVSTPDHTHFHPAYWAIERNKHLYLEKPLGHSVWETRKITDFAREKKIATQLGVQRHAFPGLREGVELIRSGVIGKVTEVHSWVEGDNGMPDIPKDTPAVPATLNWDLWLGPAKERAYNPAYVPYHWRYWWDFGSGETGNWGCHILDIPYWALDLKYPTRVEAGGGEWHTETTPKSMTCKFQFAANEMHGPITLHWCHGVPRIATEIQPDIKNEVNNEVNNLFIGPEGMLLCGFGKWKLFPEDKFVGLTPTKTFTDSPGFHQEWIDACRGGDAATCNFDYSGPLTETVLLGNVAFRAKAGFDWDAVNLKPVGNPAAEQYLKSYFRKGWEV